jgi:hypothetical protein
MIKIKTPILIVVIVLVILIIAAVIWNGYKKPSPKPEEQAIIAKDIYGIAGTIEEIRQNALVVNALILLEDPSKAPIRQNVTVAINDQTKITKLEFPDPKTIPAGSKVPIYPKETTLKFSDLKKGDKIDIRAKENISDKIKNNTSFFASVINVAK